MQQANINVSVALDQDGNPLVYFRIDKLTFQMHPDEAAKLSGTIQSVVASIWGLKVWQASAVNKQSSPTSEKTTPELHLLEFPPLSKKEKPEFPL